MKSLRDIDWGMTISIYYTRHLELMKRVDVMIKKREKFTKNLKTLCMGTSGVND